MKEDDMDDRKTVKLPPRPGRLQRALRKIAVGGAWLIPALAAGRYYGPEHEFAHDWHRVSDALVDWGSRTLKTVEDSVIGSNTKTARSPRSVASAQPSVSASVVPSVAPTAAPSASAKTESERLFDKACYGPGSRRPKAQAVCYAYECAQDQQGQEELVEEQEVRRGLTGDSLKQRVIEVMADSKQLDREVPCAFSDGRAYDDPETFANLPIDTSDLPSFQNNNNRHQETDAATRAIEAAELAKLKAAQAQGGQVVIEPPTIPNFAQPTQGNSGATHVR